MNPLLDDIKKIIKTPPLFNNIKYNCITRYGFYPETTKSTFFNIKKYLKTTPLEDILKIKYIFHNFVTPTNIPTGTPSLISLNLKFCIETPKPSKLIKDENITHFKGRFRTHFQHNTEEPCNPTINNFNCRNNLDNDQYIPKLYIRSQLPSYPTHQSAKDLLGKFEDKIKSLMNKNIIRKVTI